MLQYLHHRSYSNSLLYSIFRDSTEAAQLRMDLHNLTQYLRTTYPEDETIKQWNDTFLHYDDILKKATTSTTKQQKTQKAQQNQRTKKDRIKQRLQAAFSMDRHYEGEVTIDLSNEQTILENLKDLNKLDNSNNRKTIFISSQQGQLLQVIKTNIPKSQQIHEYLQRHNIIYSPQKCRSLVILYNLVSEFNALLQCDVPVSFLTQNCKIIKEICKELNW